MRAPVAGIPALTLRKAEKRGGRDEAGHDAGTVCRCPRGGAVPCQAPHPSRMTVSAISMPKPLRPT